MSYAFDFLFIDIPTNEGNTGLSGYLTRRMSCHLVHM
jgi:hypothetical protein